MKKIVLALVALMLLTNVALAEGASFSATFVVGSVTQLSGNFFSKMWGNNTADADVRALIHGYSIAEQTADGAYFFDPTVVKGTSVTKDRRGNKTYVLTIQQDLTYNDGTPITAADYVFSILLAGAPAITQLGGIASEPSAIVGYGAYASGHSNALAGLRLLGDYEFSITISADSLPYFYELALTDYAPCPISVIAPGCRVADDGTGAYVKGNFTAELLAQTLLDPETGYLSHPKVTCGPYQLVSFDRSARTAYFTMNQRYKGDHTGQKPTIPDIVFREVKNATMIQELENGSVQLINKVTDGSAIHDGLALAREGWADAVNYQRSGFAFVSFACEQGPAQFQAVRQTIAHCLDTEAFTAKFTRGYGQTVYGYLGLGQWMVRMVNGLLAFEPGSEPDAKDLEALSLGSLKTYPLDLEAAEALLVKDGWTLNAEGGAYVKGPGAVRYKRVDGALMGLTLRWAKPANSTAADLLEEMIAENLAKVGIGLTVAEVPFAEMLTHYYRQAERTYDMFFLATNFDVGFDPYLNFNTADEYQGPRNTTGLRDERLMELARDLRETQPGAFLEYCRKWIAFQQRFNELLPMIPLYSNVYFDFHTPRLTGYQPKLYANWPSALLYAHLDR